jgi:hypothetical protein
MFKDYFQQLLGQNIAGRHLVINSGLGKRSRDSEARRGTAPLSGRTMSFNPERDM